MTLNDSKDFFRWLGKWVLLAYSITVILSATPLMRDSTDSKEWGSGRSKYWRICHTLRDLTERGNGHASVAGDPFKKIPKKCKP